MLATSSSFAGNAFNNSLKKSQKLKTKFQHLYELKSGESQ